MPGREYLIKGLEDKDVKAYLEYQIGLATLLGADKESARKQQTEALEFEIKLATVGHILRLIKSFDVKHSILNNIFLFCRSIYLAKNVAMPTNFTIR